MTLRVFSDGTGKAWRAWAVAPRFTPVRQRGDRRRAPAPEPVIERRRVPDRRRRGSGGLFGVAPAFTTGWLAFEAEDPRQGIARCRLAPIPEDWERCPEPELRRYLAWARDGSGARDGRTHDGAASDVDDATPSAKPR